MEPIQLMVKTSAWPFFSRKNLFIFLYHRESDDRLYWCTCSVASIHLGGRSLLILSPRSLVITIYTRLLWRIVLHFFTMNPMISLHFLWSLLKVYSLTRCKNCAFFRPTQWKEEQGLGMTFSLEFIYRAFKHTYTHHQ